MYRTITAIAAVVLFGAFSTLPVVSQAQQGGSFVFKADGGGVHQSEADLSDSGGGFAVDRWFFSAGFDYAWSQRDSIGISIGGGKSIYEFNDTAGLGGGDPWNKIDDFRVSATWRFGFGDTGSFILVPTARFNGEKDASSSDSSTYSLIAAAAWRINENLTIGPGIGIFTRLEGSSRIFPILAIEWDITERWNLSTGRGLAASQGPGLMLSYQLNEDWSLGLAGRYEDIEFRLDNEGPAAGGVGRDQSVPMIFMATLNTDSRFSLSVFAGVEFFGRLRLKDAHDEIVDESDFDPAPIFGATFEIRF